MSVAQSSKLTGPRDESDVGVGSVVVDELLFICGFALGPLNLSLQQQYATVARYGHPADLFFTPRAHVNFHVRTSTMSTFARRTPRAHVELDVRTWKLTCARRVPRAHVEFDVRT